MNEAQEIQGTQETTQEAQTQAEGNTRRRYRKITSAEEVVICNAYQRGIDGVQIAEVLGTSYIAVYNTLKRAGVPRRPRGKQPRRKALKYAERVKLLTG